MDILKCNMCGGTLEINENEGITTCEYCGTKQVLPDLKQEKLKKKSPSKIAKIFRTVTDKFSSNIKVLVTKWKSIDKKKKRKGFIVITSVICGIVILSFIGIQSTNNYIIPNIKYKKAISLYNEKRYEEAELLFNEIPRFKDSLEYSDKCVTDMVKNSNVIEFLHEQDSKLTYKDFVKLYGAFSKEDIRRESVYVMPSQWVKSQNLATGDLYKDSIDEIQVIDRLRFWNAEKIQKNYFLGEDVYISGSFYMKLHSLKYSFSSYVYQYEVDFFQNKENTVLSSLYFNVKKDVSKKHFEELVSYISTYEGQQTDIEYTNEKYTTKWISDKYEYSLTYKVKEKELRYEKQFK